MGTNLLQRCRNAHREKNAGYSPRRVKNSSLIALVRPSGSSPSFMLVGKSKSIRRDNAVTAGAFGLVHSHVGSAQNAIYRVAAFPLGNTKAARDAEKSLLRKAESLN